jgi:deoxyribonuclease V
MRKRATRWPRSPQELIDEQRRLAREPQPSFSREAASLAIAGCFVCFPRGYGGAGAAGDPGWAAAALFERRRLLSAAVVTGVAGGPYEPGLLALREGPLLEAAVRALDREPQLLLVNATGRDHPRRAGLALHLGGALSVATVGVTNRLLVAKGQWPEARRGASSPFLIDGELAGYWTCTRSGSRPLAIHAGWGIGPEAAVDAVLSAIRRARTPEPLREARHLARMARAQAG